MASIKLKPWPFESRIVKLHWFGNVRLTEGNKWIITVAFEDQRKLVLIQYPVGLLPVLKIGQFYQYGQALISQMAGRMDTCFVTDLGNGHTQNSLNVCRQFNYYLYGNAELINQRVWCFESGGVNYYIPHIELIRALFAKNKTLANALFRPNGLFYLLNYYHSNNKQALFDFSREIPGSVINDSLVQHFSWLYLQPEIRNAFESVQTNVYTQAIRYNNGLAFGQAIELSIPKLTDSEWSFRGRLFGKHVLVYEIHSFTVAKLPVDCIEYSHLSIKRYVYCDNFKKKRVSFQGKEHTFEIDNEKINGAKVDINQPVVESGATQMKFEKSPEIRRIAKYEQEINQGDIYYYKQGRGGTSVASVDESIAGGNIQPVELKTLEVTCERDGFGLEDFYKMIKQLGEMHPDLRLSMNVINLPTGRKFSWLSGERRRVCALVRVDRVKSDPIYILEIARPDKKPLSTLIVQFDKFNKYDEESTLSRLLLSLVYNGGSWPLETLKGIKHVRQRHINTNPVCWAEKLYEKILLLIQADCSAISNSGR